MNRTPPKKTMNIPFINFQSKHSIDQPKISRPEHVAIIMDGNGRWTKKRGMPRIAGHKEGISTVVKIAKAATQQHIRFLTLYTFSTENWKRPKAEVDFLLKLPKEFLNDYLPPLIENNVRVGVIGELEHLPPYTREAFQYAMDRTGENCGLQLNFALNYGSKHEIISAVKNIISDINDGKRSMEDIKEVMFSNYLYTTDLPDPDLLIRTGGEKRLSNFLLWQLAYTEFWFTNVLWPDFTEEDFLHALEEYGQRKRRFGSIEA